MEKCIYCEGAEALVTGKTNDYGIALLFPNILNAYGYDVHGTGSNGLSVRINYCPMCGKELKGVSMKNQDNITKAIEGLDQFTKNWCMNCKETEKKNDLVFRCKECIFKRNDSRCLVKLFANNHESNFDMSKFGSMSR